MPTPVGHSIFGLTVYVLVNRRIPQKADIPGIMGYCFLANLPDIDFAPVLVYGISAVKVFHQYYTHNIGFCLVASIIIALFWSRYSSRRFFPILGLTFLLVTSHIVFDSCGYDSRPPYGIQFFWPLTSAYFTSPVSIFIGAAKGTFSEMFSSWNLYAVLFELAVFLPMLLMSIRHIRAMEAGSACWKGE